MTNASRYALTGVALAAGLLFAGPSSALGLGRINVQSALGETLRAEIEVSSITPEEASSLRLRVAPAEAYRAAGVDYNAALNSAQVTVVRRPDGRSVLRVTNDRAVLEPFVELIVEASWASGRLVREYTMLFDPPGARQAQAPAAQSAAPVISAPAPAPAPAPSAAVAQPMPAPAAPPPVAMAPAPAPASAPAAAAPATSTARMPTQPRPVPAAAEADSVTVRSGDTLSRIAGRTQRQGVSLDQMLVSLFRANPQAFMGDNMNRLKSGAVLSVPSADDVAKVPQPEAREVIVAQSADFSAFRQRLAAGTTATADAAPARQAGGKVQAQVDDRKPGAAPTPDKLKLSQGALQASAAEARTSKEAEKKDAAARLAELSRNVNELKKLQGAAGPAGTGTPAAPAPAAPAVVAAAPKPAPAPAPATPPPPPPAPPAAPPAPAPAPVVVAPPPPAPASAAAAPPPVAAAPASAAVAAAPPASVAKAVVPPPPRPTLTPPTAEEEPGILDSLLDNPLLLPGAGVLVLLLGGLGLYKLRGRLRKPGGETSFLESRLQPDSFFGASGGQRIDTRDAAPAGGNSNASSMSYSLSQLDAIGDVDPVAEADVYLAYGRDLQAEEILKEAMRADPERRAIRVKLLEVYAKRRDTKGFELLATQLYNLTHGEGEEWPKVQALGLTIDPDNPLYQRGGQPEEVIGAHGRPVEPLGASTVPYTAPAGPAPFQPADDATLDGGIDLALDLELPADPPAYEATTNQFTATQHDIPAASRSMGLDFPAEASRGAQAAAQPMEVTVPPLSQPSDSKQFGNSLDFELGDLGGDTKPPVADSKPADLDAHLDFGDFSLDPPPDAPPSTMDDPEADGLARKLELAEEFRQIGDMEGARDLLEEVLSKAQGSLRAKAQGMLDTL
jgi:pilus assembly protein FimV